MLEPLCETFRMRLEASPHPVERDIAGLLSGTRFLESAASFRLQRYHRKIDVARRVMAAYDDAVDKPTSTDTLTSEGYMGLALVFVEAARREIGVSARSRADTLRWANSAFNCMDLVGSTVAAGTLTKVEAELQAILLKVSPA